MKSKTVKSKNKKVIIITESQFKVLMDHLAYKVDKEECMLRLKQKRQGIKPKSKY
jgi:hypothetical protein